MLQETQEMEERLGHWANNPKKLTNAEKRKEREVRKAAELAEQMKADEARKLLEAEKERRDAEFMTNKAAREKAEEVRIEAEYKAAEEKSKAEIEAKKAAKATGEAQKDWELEESWDHDVIVPAGLENQNLSSQGMADQQLLSPFFGRPEPDEEEGRQERDELNDDVMETDVNETENEVILIPASQQHGAQGWIQLLETQVSMPGEEEGG